MNTVTKNLIALVILTLASSSLVCAAEQPKFTEPTAVRAEVEKAVLEVNARMTAAADRLDADAFFDFILEGDKGVIIQSGAIFNTRADALAAVKRGFKGLSKVERRFENPHVTVVSADLAILVSDGSVNATLQDGRVMNSRFAVSLVFVRQNGVWKLLHGHYSVPMAAQ